jgi:AcrR family transcriptional regulator
VKLKSGDKPKLAAADRRRQLVSIAMDLIAAKGFEGLRFQEVAKEAGINNATLVYHFSTKEELIMGVMQQLGEELRQTPGRPDNRPATALEELRLEFASIGVLLRERPKLFIVIVELSMRALRDPGMGNIMTNLDDFWRQHLTSIIGQGIQEGAFRADIDVEAVATAWMAQVKGIGFHALTAKLRPAELDRSITEVAGQVERYLIDGRGRC